MIAESYQDDVTLRLYKNANAVIDFVNDCPTCVEEDQHLLGIRFSITDYVTLSIGDSFVPGKSQALLDFDALESNKQRSFDMHIGGRAGQGRCAVTIRSENGSKLIREDVAMGAKSRDEIHYRVRASPEMGSPIVQKDIDVPFPINP